MQNKHFILHTFPFLIFFLLVFSSFLCLNSMKDIDHLDNISEVTIKIASDEVPGLLNSSLLTSINCTQINFGDSPIKWEDTDFISGSGNVSDPYIIENLEIRSSNETRPYLRHSGAYVQFINCRFMGPFFTLHILDSRNINITHCEFVDARYVLLIGRCSNLEISWCRFSSTISSQMSCYGIYCYGSENISIENNIISGMGYGDGIFLDNSNDILIEKNTIFNFSIGIFFLKMYDCIIQYNDVEMCQSNILANSSEDIAFVVFTENSFDPEDYIMYLFQKDKQNNESTSNTDDTSGQYFFQDYLFEQIWIFFLVLIVVGILLFKLYRKTHPYLPDTTKLDLNQINGNFHQNEVLTKRAREITDFNQEQIRIFQIVDDYIELDDFSEAQGLLRNLLDKARTLQVPNVKEISKKLEILSEFRKSFKFREDNLVDYVNQLDEKFVDWKSNSAKKNE